jgi:hypothetical protein
MDQKGRWSGVQVIEVCRPTAKVGVAFERREGTEDHVSVDVDVREIGAWSTTFHGSSASGLQLGG